MTSSAAAKPALAPSSTPQKDMANALRVLSIDAVEKAKSGHPGLPMGAADVATVLFTKFLKFDASQPDWPDRDRFVLSAGHGSMLLYALLHLTGHDSVTIEDIKNFRQLGFKTPGHPENFVTQGIETTTGPLGQGIATAIGMALGERIQNATFGDGLVDHFTYVLASDGDLMEGISHEAAALAGHLKLNRLIVLFDDNGITIDGPLSLSDSTDQVNRFQSYGWNACAIDGHDHEAIAAAIARAKTSDNPTLIACKTKIGYGAPNREGTSKAHGEPLGADELSGAKQSYGWSAKPFDVPSDILDNWRTAGARGKAEREAWEKRSAAQPGFAASLKLDVSAIDAALIALKQQVAADAKEIATRKSSEIALETLTPLLPQMIGGSADLSPSNNTRAKAQNVIDAQNYGGSYLHYGIREHAMAAAMNGLALHGFIPYGGTFLTFADYCRPAVRLAALMGLRSIFVMTHDSIGLGEDGPTHQPVEHVASLRAMPNLIVFRPADTVETIESWQCALENAKRPSLLALSRQNLPQLRKDRLEQNLTARGAYVLSDCEGAADVSLFASGSELHLAVEAKAQLDGYGLNTRVISVPCFELFDEQDEAYQRSVIGDAKVNIAVEAGVKQGWERFIGNTGTFIGMSRFGASAPAKVLFEHFGITTAAIVKAAKDRLRAS